MRKTLILLALSAVVALASASVAFAAGGRQGNMAQSQNQGNMRQPQNQRNMRQPRNRGDARAVESPGRQYFTLVGVISGIGEGSITVEIHNGNRFVKEYIGGELAVEVADGAEYRRWTPSGCVPIDPTEIAIGDTTSIRGTVIEGVYWAERITVDVPLDCCNSVASSAQ